jgi:hypothetical protein
MPATKPRLSLIKTTRPSSVKIAEWIPQSSGYSRCDQCTHMYEDLGGITLCGLCVACALQADPSSTVTLRSDPFWLLSPEEMDRAAVELQHLHAEYEQLEGTLPDGDWGEAERPTMDELKAIEREAMLLQLLRVVSRMGGTR